MLNHLKPAAMMLLLFTLLTGAVYPLLVTALAHLFFAEQANGSLIKDDQGRFIGSELIGQSFTDPRFFWGRPSATMPQPYNAAASSASNLGPTNPVLHDNVRNRIAILKQEDSGNNAPIPVDLVTASGSGLDPHISIAAAEYQITRIARHRNIDTHKLQALIRQNTDDRQWWFLGEQRVNVVRLNLALEGMR
jgi:potassium-transporting ATPase KdpC subunit